MANLSFSKKTYHLFILIFLFSLSSHISFAANGFYTQADSTWDTYEHIVRSPDAACKALDSSGPNGFTTHAYIDLQDGPLGLKTVAYCYKTTTTFIPPSTSLPTQQGSVGKHFFCPPLLPGQGYTCSDCCYHSPPLPANPTPKGNGPPPSCHGDPNLPHPIKISSGNKWLQEEDIKSSLDLKFTRTYNSGIQFMPFSIGRGWTHSYSAQIQTISGNSAVFRPDGKVYVFTNTTGILITDADITDKLTELKDANNVRTGWTYKVDATGALETYNAEGLLLSLKDRAGNTLSMSYSDASTPISIAPGSNLLIKVTNHLGQSISFVYDLQSRMTSMTNLQGGVTTYAYSDNSGDSNLSSVTYPDGKVKTYHYGETSFVSSTPANLVSYKNSLTGITDENGARYATYYYDAQGRAYAENLANGADAASIAFTIDIHGEIASTVTDARGSLRTYNFTPVLDVLKMTGQSQPAGSGCNASTSAMSYDANGNVASRTDFNGNKTTYVYDMARNLEASRTEGLTTAGVATPATRTITTTYHATWRLPLVISEYTGASATGTPLKRTTYVYDAKGNLTSYKEEDPVRTLSRTTTTTYTYSTVVPGLVLQKVVNGPRTDVTDVTTYVYYPHDATCTASTATPIIDPITGTAPANLGCRGQLQSVTNALGQITTYDRYNHHGQVEQMTDANGIVTTNEYDLRQRLLSRSVGNTTPETTTLVYDDAGQIIQLGMPNASTLSYTYDDAHRLIQIQDTLGNKVVYTLDDQGNRTQETLSDPLGNLTKTITRSYDALNRLQQVTGVE